MTDERAQFFRDRLRRLQAERVNFDTVWDRIARVVLPSSVGFTSTHAPGSNLNQEIFDSTAQLALPRFAAALDTLVTPQTNVWHQLRPKNRALRGSSAVQQFMSGLNDLLFSVRYSPKAGFANRAFEVYMSLGAFGNGVIYVHDAQPGIRYLAVHMSEIWFAEDANGVIDTAYWVHSYTQRQAVQRWGDRLPKDVIEDATANPKRKLKFCKAVYPRADRNPKQRDNLNMPFASVTFLAERGYAIVEESGYRTFPFAVARYITNPCEVYGRSPAQDALADIQTLNQMVRTGLRYGQLVTDPPWMVSDADSLDPFSVVPGAINYGYLSPDGVERVKPLRPQGDPGFGLELADQRRQAINGAFLVNLFQVLVESGSDRMTATEVMQRVQEKGALLGPIGGRLRTEFLGPLIEREIDILFHAGVIDPASIPEELLRDGDIDIEYDSPLTRAMKAEEGVGILRTLEFVGQTASQVAAADQARAARMVRKVNYERALERLAEINGAPPDIMRSEEEMAEDDEAEQANVQTQQLLQAAPLIADTAKTLAETQQIATNQSAVI